MRKRKRPTYGSVGTVSSGTLRLEDLFTEFLYACKHLRLSRDERNTVRRIDATAVQNLNPDELDEQLEYDVQELQSILENHAAPYMYFGTLDGDGAEFGFWLGDLEDFDGLKVKDVAEVPTGYTGEVLLVNDHGNTTLLYSYHGRMREIWSVV